MSGLNLARLADLPRWVAWRNEPRHDKPEKITKVPYSPGGGKAKADDPATWGTRSQAEARARKIVNGFGGGIGIELGPIDEVFIIGGIDLDTCRDENGQLEPWAEEVIRRFATYTETSPSGTGEKLFFRFRIKDFEAVKPLLGGAKTGKQFKIPSGNDHPPGIEIYFQDRYFAVTEQHLASTPDELTIVPRETVDWLLREAGPALTKDKSKASKGSGGSDKSRSAAAFRLGLQMRRAGSSYEDFRDALRTDPETDRWYAEKGIANGQRELKRIWQKAAHNGEGWRAKLILNEANKPLAILANAITAFRGAPEWNGLLAYDVFHLRIAIRRKAPWPELPGDEWTSVHDIRAAEWLQHQDIFVGPDIAGQAVEAVAREHHFHPVLDYLNRCVWDSKPRLDLWVVDYLGAADTPYNRAVGARWMISAVARVHEPGCKVDSALVLEGDQNIGKSTAIKTLGAPWFTDEIADLGTKDAALQLAGVWIVELAELDSVSRSDASRIKAFMSRATDRYRPPYSRRPIEQPRQCVYAGTINHSEYLRDETGNRRFWPLKCTKIDIPGLTKVRDQLWAEACFRYREGKPWHLDTKELNDDAEAEQSARYHHDAWEEPIAIFIAGRTTVSVGEILKDALFITTDKWSQQDQNRVARILRLFKWQRKQERVAGTDKRRWMYHRPDVVGNQGDESGDLESGDF